MITTYKEYYHTFKNPKMKSKKNIKKNMKKVVSNLKNNVKRQFQLNNKWRIFII